MIRISHISCDHQAFPLGLGSLSPTVSWRLEAGGRRGAKQTAYRLRIASRQELLEKPDVFCGEWIQSEQTTFVATSGPALCSRERRYWSVQVRDELGEESAWAPSAWFEAGLIQPSDWQAAWIAGGRMGSPWHGVPAPLLRKSFVVAGNIRKARLYATALGLYRLSINGKAAHVDEFSPGWTDYRQRVRARTYDVTGLIQKGENVLGAILGDGWWCGQVEKRARQLYGEKPLLCVQLEVEQEDGTMLVVASDGSWRWSDGPIVVSDLIDGEHFDARQAKPGWNIAGFDDRLWLPVSVEATPKIKIEPRLVVWTGGETGAATLWRKAAFVRAIGS